MHLCLYLSSNVAGVLRMGEGSSIGSAKYPEQIHSKYNMNRNRVHIA